MSAMRAEELPEVPAASPPDSARIRAVARWTGAGQAAPAATIQGQVICPEPLPIPPVRPRPARPQPTSPPLRLTRRGRVVVAIATVLVLAVLSLVIAASAQATNHPVPASGTQHSLAQVTVRPGQSLWSVAEAADPDADTRVVIQQIIELNGLSGDVVFAGQQLWVPRG
jgi:LysM repeat protein